MGISVGNEHTLYTLEDVMVWIRALKIWPYLLDFKCMSKLDPVIVEAAQSLH